MLLKNGIAISHRIAERDPFGSLWTAKVRGATMSLSSGFGGRSNTRKCISEPMARCPRPGLLSEDTSNFTIADGHIRASAGGRPIRLTSTGYRMSRRRNYRIGIVALGPRRRRREGCGYAALRAAKLGQRESVAHMPTAEAEDTAQSCMIGFGKTQSGWRVEVKNEFKRSRSAGPSFSPPRQGFHLNQTGKTVQTNRATSDQHPFSQRMPRSWCWHQAGSMPVFS